jgi:hypothetical protein
MSKAVARAEVVELDERARRSLARRHPELSGYGAAVVVAASPPVRDSLTKAIRRLARAANDGDRLQVERLIDALCPNLEVPEPRVLEEARREAQRRVRILRDFGALRAGAVAAVAGSSAANRSQLASRWRRERRVFAVPYRGSWWYLGFQFDAEARPRPVIARVLETFVEREPWDVANWFVFRNRHLAGRPPVELLGVDDDAVVAAAHRPA